MNFPFCRDPGSLFPVFLVWTCLVSVSVGAKPNVSFPDFIPWDNPTLPTATINGGTPPYDVTYEVADKKVPVGYDFRVDIANGPLVNALSRELQYRNIGAMRIREFEERSGRPPIGVPLHTHIRVDVVDAVGTKFYGRFTPVIEIPDDVRSQLVTILKKQAEAQRLRRLAELQQEEIQKRVKNLDAAAKRLVEARRNWWAIAALFGISVPLGSLTNSLCLKATDGIASLYIRDLQWMSSASIARGATSIAVISFITIIFLGRFVCQVAYYSGVAPTPDAVLAWWILTAVCVQVVTIAGVLSQLYGFRGVRLIASTGGFFVLNFSLAFLIWLLFEATDFRF